MLMPCRETRKKVIFFVWTTSVYLFLEYLSFDITVDYQHKTRSNAVAQIENIVKMVKKTNLEENNSYLPLPKPPSKLKVEDSSTDIQNDKDFIRENNFVMQHSTPSTERIKYLNSIRSPEKLTHEMQSTILLMLKIILKGIKRVILLDLAQIENKGDPAITYGELVLLGKLDIEVIYYSCYYTSIEAFREAASNALIYNKTEVAVLSSGGGNFGIYESNDKKRTEMLQIFHEYKFILLSQSVWFGGDNPSEKEKSYLHRIQASFEKHPDASIMLRDQWSYDYCKKHFPMVKLYLVPDMAFGMGKLFSHFVHQPLYDIVWIKRNDKESPGGVDAVIPSNVSFAQEDWSKNWPSPVGANLIDWSYMMVHNAALFLLRGRVVITDRLHGFVLAKFTNAPVVIIDNNIKKISRFVNTWCQGLTDYHWASNKQKALEKALMLLKHA